MDDLKLLLLEDYKEDCDLIQAVLKRAGVDFKVMIVSTRKNFIEALDFFPPDLILSDHRLPQFSSIEALQIARNKLPYVPFILVTGTISDDFASSLIQGGADDYILKSNLKRLPTAIHQAIAKKQTEKAQAMLVSIVNSSDDAIISKTMDGSILTCNSGAEKLFGYSCQEAIGMNISMLIPPGRLNEEVEIMLKIKNGQSVMHCDTQRQMKNGQIIDISLTISPIKDTLGNIIGASEIARDITERIQAEQQKKFDSNNLSALINNTKDLMWSVDRDIRLITFNDSFKNVIELISGKSIAKGHYAPSSQFTEEQFKHIKSFYERALSGESFMVTGHFTHPVTSWSEISFYPIREGNSVIGSACFSHDITEHRLAELERIKLTDDLIQQNKDLEQFSYIVSHNLRAPVANILGVTSGLNYPGINKTKKDLLINTLNKSVMQLDHVLTDINQILQVKREINKTEEIVRFSTLVEEIKISIKNLVAKDNIVIQYDFSEVDEHITLKSYLHSIFYNLISNSINYRRPGIACIIQIKSHLVKDTIELIFTDNGMGIDLEKNGEHVFGLYKRFHANIEGKGIGLFMVKTQVKTLGGKISIQSEVDKGTEFKIEFER